MRRACKEMPFWEVWAFNMDQLIAAVPALADEDSVLSKQMVALLELGGFDQFEDGFLRAFKIIIVGNRRYQIK